MQKGREGMHGSEYTSIFDVVFTVDQRRRCGSGGNGFISFDTDGSNHPSTDLISLLYHSLDAFLPRSQIGIEGCVAGMG